MPEDNNISIEERFATLQNEISALQSSLISSVADLKSMLEKPKEEVPTVEIPKPQENNVDHWGSLFE